jgi:transposase
MDRDSLTTLLKEGLSLAEIGRRLDKHEATVSYWMKKYGLEASNRTKHAARGPLEKTQLEALVCRGASIAEIAAEVDRSKATVRHWLKQYGLQTNGPVGGPLRPGVAKARGIGQVEPVLDCPRHGTVTHVLEPRGYYRCRQCRIEAVARRRRKVKAILVAEAGGTCRLCGYDKCFAALEFHHLDPNTKRFGLSRRGARSIARLRLEAQKCVLLCSNCHAEVEAGTTKLP